MTTAETHTDRGEFEAAVAERTWDTCDPRWGILTRAVELAEMVNEAPEAASTRTASVWRAELLIEAAWRALDLVGELPQTFSKGDRRLESYSHCKANLTAIARCLDELVELEGSVD